jgi:energy-coupling factor transporter ATP-binding protein EcfA2
VLERVWAAPLKNVSLRAAAGLSVLVGAESDGAGVLVELCAGVREPRRGQLALGGVRPSASAECRRAIASLLPDETGGIGPGDVHGWLAELARLIGFEPATVLDGCGLDPTRPLSTLSRAERRELALAIALAHPHPALVVLHEPLSACAAVRRERVLVRLAELASACPVLIATASIADARRIGGATYLLDRGLCDAKPGGAWPGSLTPGLGACIALDADDPRRLVAALAQHPDVRELSYDERRGGRVLASGTDLEALALAIARAAVGAGVDIRLLRAQAEGLDAARAASAATEAAAHQRAGRARGRATTSTTPQRSASAPSSPVSPDAPKRAS